MTSSKIKGHLVVGGSFHDMDFARLELLKLLSDYPFVRMTVSSDYSEIENIESADFLMTYTCNVVPSLDIQERLQNYIKSGRRWFALHGTNSILEFLKDGRVDCPESAPVFMKTLGSQFMAHPPIGEYIVRVTNPQHPLVAGIDDFKTTDELYLSSSENDLEVLLECDFTGNAGPFVREEWAEDSCHAVMYLHRVGEGQVLYNNLGHCRGHYDMEPLIEYYPEIERCSWDIPQYRELLKRGIEWCFAPMASKR